MNLKEKLQSSLLKDTVWLTISDAATRGIGGVLALLLARFLGPESYGSYAIALSITSIIFTITMIGFENYFLKAASTTPDKRDHYYKSLLSLVTVSNVIALLGTIAFMGFSDYSAEIITLSLILAGYSIAIRYHISFRFFCMVNERLKTTAVLQSLCSITLLATVGIALWQGQDVLAVTIIQAVVAGLTTIAWFVWMPKQALRPAIDRSALKSFLRGSMPFAFSNIIWILYFNFDTFMISVFKSVEDAGVYAGVFKIFSLNYIFGYAVVSAFSPRLFKQFVHEPAQYMRTAKQSLLALLALSLPLFALLYLAADIYIPLIIGESYRESGVIVAQTLSFALFFRMLNFGFCEILASSGQQKQRVYFEIALLLCNIGLNYLLIPHYGTQGAAFATVFAELLFFILSLLLIVNSRSKLKRNIANG
jgi:O-antigen/teichoic acid export membrane protein